jgi:bifunctional ADP-heptose synthase (sugar kinase/adenylyltransferase)
LDTRTKILPPDSAANLAAAVRAAGERVRLITGWFDVLQAAHARAFAEAAAAGGALFVAVLDGPSPVLPLRARAEMVAALAAVRCVIAVDGDLDAVIAAVGPAEILRWERDDAERLRQLIEHVKQRHAG